MSMKTKLISHEDAKLLYDDVRDRIEDTKEDVGDLSSALNNKANKADTVLTTTLSLGRKSNTTVGNNSTTLGNNNTASGERSLATGFTTVASGGNAVTEGYSTEASGSNSHAEGYDTTASGAFSHSDGKNTVASGESSRASGLGTVAAGRNSSAFGAYNVLDSYSDWPEWAASTQYAIGDKVKRTTTSSGVTTVAGYICKTANSDSTFTYSNWDDQNGKMNYAEIVGNGTANNARSNARTLDWDGNEELAGDLTVFKGTASETSLTTLKSAINVLEPQASSSDVGKFLKAKTVVDGKVSEYEFGEASGGVSDVQVNGTSVVSQGVANIPVGVDNGALGVSRPYAAAGVAINASGTLYINKATDAEVKAGTNTYHPIVPSNQHHSVFYSLAKAAGDSTQASSNNSVGNYTETALSKISDMLNAPVSVSGSTPSITAKPGVRYICGECSTLTVVVPATGIIDVVFESGSTPTVLTVTPPTGVTMRWANGFDPTSLKANTTYEINIMDGCMGVAGKWT